MVFKLQAKIVPANQIEKFFHQQGFLDFLRAEKTYMRKEEICTPILAGGGHAFPGITKYGRNP